MPDTCFENFCWLFCPQTKGKLHLNMSKHDPPVPLPAVQLSPSLTCVWCVSVSIRIIHMSFEQFICLPLYIIHNEVSVCCRSGLTHCDFVYRSAAWLTQSFQTDEDSGLTEGSRGFLQEKWPLRLDYVIKNIPPSPLSLVLFHLPPPPLIFPLPSPFQWRTHTHTHTS